MSIGLLALLDDVAAFARLAAASLDDVAAQAGRAGTKAAGVVIDDAAVTPRYFTALRAERELPIVGRITLGSLRNKLLILLPLVLALGYFAPWLITPLLAVGGAYLCYEGAEKVLEVVLPHSHADEKPAKAAGGDARLIEEQTVTGAVRTDFVLSTEIMFIILASVTEGSIWTKAVILAVVGVGITLAVYGTVAVIVKADDVGLAMAGNRMDSWFGSIVRNLGRAIVGGMPYFLACLAFVGTAAMIWVGGGILVHALEAFGVAGPAHAVHDIAHAASAAVPAAAGFVEWAVEALCAGVLGLLAGAALVPVSSLVVPPVVKGVSRLRGQTA